MALILIKHTREGFNFLGSHRLGFALIKLTVSMYSHDDENTKCVIYLTYSTGPMGIM